MSMELIHIQIYQSRHFSFSLMLLRGNGYLCLYQVKININSAVAQSTI